LACGQALASNVHCGDVLTHSVKLDSDLLNCPGDGLVVGAPSIRIDFNGHTLDGVPRQSGVGISNTGRYDNVVVTGGVVSDFTTGILVVGARKTDVESMRLRDNGIFGLNLLNTESSLVRHTSIERSYGGLLADGEIGGRFASNTLSGNSSFGLQLSGSTRTAVRSNVLTSNEAGVVLTRGATANTLENNSLTKNGATDFLSLSANSVTVMESSNNRLTHNVVRSAAGIAAVLFIHSDHNSFIANDLSTETPYGLAVVDSAVTLISDNSVEAASSGIVILVGSHNSVKGNEIWGGTEGVALQRTHDNEIAWNLVTDEDTGMLLASVVAHNTFRANKVLRNRGTGILLVGFGETGSDGNQFIGNEVSDNLADGLRSRVVPDEPGEFTDSLFRNNVFERNRNDGLRLDGPSNTVSANEANENGHLGIEAALGVTDGGGNTASGNGDPRQCVNVSCSTRGQRK
jgi:parallel beta-helix repeat protein